MRIISKILLLFGFISSGRQVMAQGVISVNKITVQSYTGTIGDKQVRMNLELETKRSTIKGFLIFSGTETPLELTDGIIYHNGEDFSGAFFDFSNLKDSDRGDKYLKGNLTAYIETDGMSGTYVPKGSSSPLNVKLIRVFEASFVDSSLRAAYINHNPDFKLDTVYTLSLDEVGFLNLPNRVKLRNIKYWYSYPMISIMARNDYQDLNSVGNVKLEEMGFQDGDYLLQQNKGFRHASFPYRYRNGYSVAYADQHFLSMCSDVYIYNGASHPFTNITYKNYDLTTGDSLKLDSLFLRGGKYFLDSVGEICFRKQNGIGPDANLYTAGYYWTDSTFHVNTNFYFTISGICFVYNTYEISSYSMGNVKFIIPYDMLKPIIRRKGPLGWVRNE